MKKSISTAMMALAALVLIFCIAFTVVQLVGSDYGFFEKEFMKLGLDSSMNMTIGDISKGLQALMEYMNGKVDSIDVDIMLNGELTPMYVLDIEHIHMEEVREVWRGFETARNLGFLVAALLVLGAVMTDNRNPLKNGVTGYLWALGLVLVLCLFLGVWAGTNFNSFWTQFHKIIFPNSDNWLLPSSSRMIQMLPGDLFQDVVMRCGLIIILILVALGIGAVVALVVPRRKLEKAQAAASQSAPKKEHKEAVLQQEAPDLVMMHKLLNMSVTRRKEMEAELALQKQQEAEKKEAQQGEEEVSSPETARVKIDFAAYEGEEPAAQVDEEELEEAAWLQSLDEERKAKQKAAGKKSSGKKKKKKKTGDAKKTSPKEPELEAQPVETETENPVPTEEDAVQEEMVLEDIVQTKAPVEAEEETADAQETEPQPQEETENEHEQL